MVATVTNKPRHFLMTTKCFEDMLADAQRKDHRIARLRLEIEKAVERLRLPGASAADRAVARELTAVLKRDEKEVPR